MNANSPMTTCTLLRASTELRRPPLRLLGHALTQRTSEALLADHDSNICPAMLDVRHFVEDLAALVEKALGDLDDFNRVAPEIDSRYCRVLRLPDEGSFLLDRVLELTRVDAETVAVRYYLGDAGFDVPDGALILHGQLIYDGSDRQNFHLTVDLSAASSVDRELRGSGEIRLQSRALEDGGQEIWCDFCAVSDGEGKDETSFAKYRVDATGSGELEYVVNEPSEVSTVQASWDARGGESTHRLELLDDPLGSIQYTTTRGWNERGVETSSVFGFSRGRSMARPPGRQWPRGSGTHAIPAVDAVIEPFLNSPWTEPPLVLSAGPSRTDDVVVTGVWRANGRHPTRELEQELGELGDLESELGETRIWRRGDGGDAAQTQIFRRHAAWA